MDGQERFVTEMKGSPVEMTMQSLRGKLEKSIQINNMLAANGLPPALDPKTGYHLPSSPPLRDSTGCIYMSSEDAKLILDNCSFISKGRVRQRPITPSRVEKHNRMFLAGQWNPGSPIDIVVLPDESMYLNNGQHRLMSVVQTGARWMRVSMIYVQTIEQAELHWAATDRNQTSRPVEMALEMHLKDILDDGTVTLDELKTIVRATRVLNASFTKWTVTGKETDPLDSDLASAVRYFLKPAVECFKLIRSGFANPNANKKVLENVASGPVLALMLLTMSTAPADGQTVREYKHDPKVFQFWEDIILGNDMPNTNQRVV